MAIKKIRMRPEGTNDYADVLHPETSASVVIEETNKKFMTDAERSKLSGIANGANNYTHPTGTNPHSTTKADVGLANLLNYAIATTAEAQAGSSNVKYMTPLRVSEAILSAKKFASGLVSVPWPGSIEVNLSWEPTLVIATMSARIAVAWVGGNGAGGTGNHTVSAHSSGFTVTMSGSGSGTVNVRYMAFA